MQVDEVLRPRKKYREKRVEGCESLIRGIAVAAVDVRP
jgi:hypothetical protein